MTRVRLACSVELDSRVPISRKHCLMLAMGDNPHVSLKSARVTCTLSLRSVPSRKGWMATYKERHDKILNMDWKVIKLIAGTLIIFYGN